MRDDEGIIETSPRYVPSARTGSINFRAAPRAGLSKNGWISDEFS